MKLSNHVLMNRNAPASKPSINISDGFLQCLSPKWVKTFTSDKDQQTFINQSYRCDSVKVKNTRLYLQQVSLTNLFILLKPPNFVY